MEISKWNNYILFATSRRRQCFYHKEIQQWCFFIFFPSLLRRLKERGVFPTIFQFCLPAADRNPFLARDPQEKQGTLWSGVPRSIVADIRPFLLTLLLLRFSCPVSFLVFATDTIYSRTIELPLSTWTITRVSENNLFPFGTFSRIIVCPSKIES